MIAEEGGAARKDLSVDEVDTMKLPPSGEASMVKHTIVIVTSYETDEVVISTDLCFQLSKDLDEENLVYQGPSAEAVDVVDAVVDGIFEDVRRRRPTNLRAIDRL